MSHLRGGELGAYLSMKDPPNKTGFIRYIRDTERKQKGTVKYLIPRYLLLFFRPITHFQIPKSA